MDEVKPLVVIERGHGQFEVNNLDRYIANWDRQYISFSGYMGEYNPNLFAVAPVLLDVLTDIVLNEQSLSDGRLKAARYAIAQANKQFQRDPVTAQ